MLAVKAANHVAMKAILNTDKNFCVREALTGPLESLVMFKFYKVKETLELPFE